MLCVHRVLRPCPLKVILSLQYFWRESWASEEVDSTLQKLGVSGHIRVISACLHVTQVNHPEEEQTTVDFSKLHPDVFYHSLEFTNSPHSLNFSPMFVTQDS